MANTKYDNVDVMPDLNWDTDNIVGVLKEGVLFITTDHRLSATSGTEIARVQIPGRYLDIDNKAMGGAAVFKAVPRGKYQMVLVKDDDSGDPWLLAYYELDLGNSPLWAHNSGTLILRPVSGDPPQPGCWLEI